MRNQSNNLSISCFTLQRITEIFNDLFSLCTFKRGEKKKRKRDILSSFKQCKMAADPGQVAHPGQDPPHYFSLFVASFKLSETINLEKEW